MRFETNIDQDLALRLKGNYGCIDSTSLSTYQVIAVFK